MIHIKETEIIPFLKTAQTGYTKMISEGDLEMEVELAEKVEEALTQAMDILSQSHCRSEADVREEVREH